MICSIDPAQCAMVGDDIVTDIGGAQAAGLRTILVRTGKFRPEDLESAVQAGCDHRFDCRSENVRRDRNPVFSSVLRITLYDVELSPMSDQLEELNEPQGNHRTQRA